jgi:hypothetical protein
MQDSIVESIREQLLERSNVGIKKYGVTLDRNDLSLLEWLEHAKQEQMDSVLYLEKIIQELKKSKSILKDYPQTQNQPLTYVPILGKHNQTY